MTTYVQTNGKIRKNRSFFVFNKHLYILYLGIKQIGFELFFFYQKSCTIRELLAYLGHTCYNPNRIKDRICEDSLEHVTLSVNFSRIKLIEQRHHDERIENYGEMLTWRSTMTRFNVQ